MHLHRVIPVLFIIEQIHMSMTSTAGERRFYSELSQDLERRFSSTSDRLIDSVYRRRRATLPADHPVLATLGIEASIDGITETTSIQATYDSLSGLVKFHLPSSLSSQDIDRVKLYVHSDTASSSSSSPIRRSRKSFISVTLFDDINQKNSTAIRRVPRMSTKDGWFGVKVLGEPLTELIKAYKGKIDSLRMSVTSQDSDDSSLPFSLDNLPILVIEGTKNFMQRDEPTQTQAQSDCVGSCCVKPLMVDFDELGYDWIIYPRRYVANYCEGTCSLTSMTADERAQLSANTNIIQAMLRRIGSTNTGSCCVPKTTTPVRIVYQDNTGSIRSDTTTLKTVTSCHCS